MLACVAGATVLAHHSVAAKFDESKTQTLSGIVTLVDWRNPHVHVFLNVRGAEGRIGELGDRAREPDRSARQRLEPGLGAAGRCHHRHRIPGAKRIAAGLVEQDDPDAGRQAGARTSSRRRRRCRSSKRPTPVGPNGVPRLGIVPGGGDGYWALPEFDRPRGEHRQGGHPAGRSAAKPGCRCGQGCADAALGASLYRSVRRGSCRTIRRSSTASRQAGRGSSSSPTASSSSRTPNGSAFSC